MFSDIESKIGRLSESILMKNGIGSHDVARLQKPLSTDDVDWAYHRFLNRAPESVEVINHHLGSSKNLKQLIEVIVESEEYKIKKDTPGPRCLNNEERIAMTCSCRDADQIPKVSDAGKVLQVEGQRVQIMHEGTRVVAGGYNGAWMERTIGRYPKVCV
jgi:hypothetical protein